MTLNYNQGYRDRKINLLFSGDKLISNLHFDVFEWLRQVFVVFVFSFDHFAGVVLAFSLVG